MIGKISLFIIHFEIDCEIGIGVSKVDLSVPWIFLKGIVFADSAVPTNGRATLSQFLYKFYVWLWILIVKFIVILL